MKRIISQNLSNDFLNPQSKPNNWFSDPWQGLKSQEPERYEIYGTKKDGKTWLASDDTFHSIQQARQFVFQYLSEFQEEGFVNLSVRLNGEYLTDIWEADEDME